MMLVDHENLALKVKKLIAKGVIPNLNIHTDRNSFLILSDINQPNLNGFELRNKIHMDAKLQTKCIPDLFFLTIANQKAVVDAYSIYVQGFFIKPNKVIELEEIIRAIMTYWT